MSSPHLRGQTPASLVALAADALLPEDVARRVLTRLVADDRDDLDGVRGLSKRARAALVARGRLARLVVLDRRRSEVDPFVKYLFRGEDGLVFESVRIPLERPRWSVCVSSQVGCALGCAFCETGRLGFTRNLEPWEMVEQVLTVRRESPERPVTGVVFQGQGEPFQNYESVIRAAEILRAPWGARIRGDRITISTVGLVPPIDRYTDEGHPYRLILSLTSAFDDKRASLMPVGSRYPVDDLAAAMRRHAAARGAYVHLAWVLMAGVNTGPEEAEALSRLFAGVRVRLSLIDVNDPTGRFRPPDAAERGRFLSALAERHIPFVRRYSGGPDIHAACGMLAGRTRGGLPVASTCWE
ncbi:MAG TPA: radical SAM protein [Vicinamibacteria bacterium]|nr:radical SAM protein [Vicinamibacteria bacterium]